MSDIDQQFIEYVVKSLVGNPDDVQVDRRVDDKGVLLELTVNPDDLGRVIGKRGATAQSLRTLLRALGTKNEARYNLKIIDNGPEREHDESAAPAERPAKQQRPVADDSATDDTSDNADDTATPVAVESAPEEVATQEPEAATSDRLERTRRELAEFDDLDV